MQKYLLITFLFIFSQLGFAVSSTTSHHTPGVIYGGQDITPLMSKTSNLTAVEHSVLVG